jgi:hypothetical protein
MQQNIALFAVTVNVRVLIVLVLLCDLTAGSAQPAVCKQSHSSEDRSGFALQLTVICE